MAFPTVNARTETSIASGTSLTIPFVQNTGDLVVIFLGMSNVSQSLTSVGDSFTNLSNAATTFHVLYKVLTGSEGGDVVVTVSSASKGAAIAYNITAGTHDSGTAPSLGGPATGTSTTPDPPSLSPAGGAKDYLWLASFRQNGEEADDDTWCTAAPTSPGTFTNLVQKTTDTAGLAATNCSVAGAEYTANTATVDPGTFSVVQNLFWRAYTLAVYPVATQSLERTTTDSATTSESVARTATFLRSTSDSATTSESLVRSLGPIRTAADSTSTSESVARLVDLLRSTDDTTSTSDSVTQLADLPRSTTDETVISEIIEAIVSLNVTASDAVTTSDVADRGFEGQRTTTDSATTADVVTRIAALARTTTDSLTTSELVEATKNVYATDAIAISDSVIAAVGGGLSFQVIIVG